MSEILYVHRATKTPMSDVNGTEFRFPVYTAGEQRTFGLRFLKTAATGALMGEDPDIRSLVASVSLIDQRPKSGDVAYQIGDGPSTAANTTADLKSNHTGRALQDAINALEDIVSAYGEATVEEVQGGYTARFANATAVVPIQLRRNRLAPNTILRTITYQLGEEWVHELRLRQAPLEATSTWLRVLPPAPKVADPAVREGSFDTTGQNAITEIQRIDFPPEFRGNYQLRRPDTMARTAILDISDGPEEVQAALQTIYGDEGTIRVTAAGENFGYVEFAGDLAGTDVPLLEVVIGTAPAGDPTFTINLNRPAVFTALRAADTIRAYLEVRAMIAKPGADEEDAGEPEILFRREIQITKDQNFDGLATAVDPKWQRPPNPVDYVPFTDDQIFIGDAHWAGAIGDGVEDTVVIDHNLDSDIINSVAVRENIANGRALVHGTDYEYRVVNATSVSVEFLNGVPGVNQYYAVVEAAGSVSAFAPHTHTKGQIVDLEPDLEEIFGRLAAVEAKVLPTIVPAVADSAVVGMETLIPEIAEVLHFKGTAQEMAALFGEKGVDASKLDPRRAPYMLPAVHDGTLTDPLPTPLPAAAANTVWVAGARTLIPGTGGVRGGYVENDGYVASDGRGIYVATRSGTTNSYYAQAFERDLFVLAINEEMLAVKRTLEILWGVQTQLLHATCAAQWVMSVQLATITADTEPATLGFNLAALNWSAPVFTRPIGLSVLAQSHFFGIRIQRTASEFLLNQNKYGNWLPNPDAAPASANFAIRGRLEGFDTENKDNPRGYVAMKLIGSIDIDEGGKQTTRPAKARIY